MNAEDKKPDSKMSYKKCHKCEYCTVVKDITGPIMGLVCEITGEMMYVKGCPYGDSNDQ